MRTQVVIVGGGPSGLLLGQLLHRHGIDTVVLERRSRAHVLGRVRAGVLERGLVDLLRAAGVASRLEAEGIVHHGTLIARDETVCRIAFTEHVDRPVTVYGQAELTRDLYEAREAAGAPIEHEVEAVTLDDLDTRSPSVSYRVGGERRRLACDFVAGCDGFHGVSRAAIPAAARREYGRVYPFGWLGVLSETPPLDEELIYASSERGFALCSMRGAGLSRHYVQCRPDDRPERWSDAAFWDELRRRLPSRFAERLVTGPSIEKSVAPLRAFVVEPMRWGRLFLCGDAAHIVPPTGAKGLNTAASDVHYLHEALRGHYEAGDEEGLERYSERALARVWKAERFSGWMTDLLHRFDERSPFEQRLQRAEFDFLRSERAAQAALAVNYVGLPY